MSNMPLTRPPNLGGTCSILARGMLIFGMKGFVRAVRQPLGSCWV